MTVLLIVTKHFLPYIFRKVKNILIIFDVQYYLQIVLYSSIVFENRYKNMNIQNHSDRIFLKNLTKIRTTREDLTYHTLKRVHIIL